MKLPTLIGVHGPLNGGKDTVADYIIKSNAIYRDYDSKSSAPFYNRYAFAKPIKEACKILFGFTQEQLEDRVLKETIDPFWGFTPRKTMQLLGTEFGRDMLRKDIWIRRAEFEIQKNKEQGYGTIITDVRFQNEADWLREQPDSMLIYLKVPNLVRDEKYQHASEAGISEAESDVVIFNDKSLGINNLHAKIDAIFN
jgi:hypothetical protein